MATRLLDTNIVSYMVNNHTLATVYHPHLAGYDWAISFQTLAELLAGGSLANWGPRRWAELEAVLAAMTVLHSDETVCEEWAAIRLARRRRPIPVADCWIAATALAYGLELVTHNPADFRGVPGLAVVTEAP